MEYYCKRCKQHVEGAGDGCPKCGEGYIASPSSEIGTPELLRRFYLGKVRKGLGVLDKDRVLIGMTSTGAAVLMDALGFYIIKDPSRPGRKVGRSTALSQIKSSPILRGDVLRLIISGEKEVSIAKVIVVSPPVWRADEKGWRVIYLPYKGKTGIPRKLWDGFKWGALTYSFDYIRHTRMSVRLLKRGRVGKNYPTPPAEVLKVVQSYQVEDYSKISGELVDWKSY